tara:strand:+ start:62 stop:184 length:123 start_codon:yes stop_codon:yes gene_type:complete
MLLLLVEVVVEKVLQVDQVEVEQVVIDHLQEQQFQYKLIQ